VSKKSHLIKLSESTRIAGIRFQQGVAALLFGPVPKQASVLVVSQQREISDLAADLLQATNHYNQLRNMYQWLLAQTKSSLSLPASFLDAMSILKNTQSMGQLTTQASLSQRQLERHYRKWLDMTPNQYLRLMRVNSALQSIKLDPQTSLVELALHGGFSDQAHMTREFKEIAAITPFKYAKLCNQTKVSNAL
jgi:transcriptional regulator GlxA family with amidase domain